MASVTFSYIYFHEVYDYDIWHRIEVADIQNAFSKDEMVFRMASGRVVAVARPGILRKFHVTAELMPRSDVEWLKLNLGRAFLVRTPHGDKFYATLNKVDISEKLLPGAPKDSKVGTCTFVMQEVTYTEEV